MLVLCVRCRKPASLETVPEGDYLCDACAALPSPPPELPPDVERRRIDTKLRQGSEELWAIRRRDRRISIPLMCAIGVGLVLLTAVPVGPGRTIGAALAGLLLFGCFLVYTFAVWFAVHHETYEYVYVWKCALLALMLSVMEIVAVASISGVRQPTCGPLLTAAVGSWFVYSMLFRSFFRVPLWAALRITMLAAVVAIMGTIAFLCVGGALVATIAARG